jgi:hypothetical protein
MHSPHYAAEWKDFTPTRESGSANLGDYRIVEELPTIRPP